MRIGLDFDHVLFNTEKFKQKLFNEIKNFDETYSDAKDGEGHYIPERHAEILGISVERIHEAICHADNCLYSDLDELKELSDKHELIVVSRGDPQFQTEKIEKSGILEYVDDYVVLKQGSKDEVANIDFLVDDSEMEHQLVNLSEDRKFLFKRPENNVKDIIRRIEQIET